MRDVGEATDRVSNLKLEALYEAAVVFNESFGRLCDDVDMEGTLTWLNEEEVSMGWQEDIIKEVLYVDDGICMSLDRAEHGIIANMAERSEERSEEYVSRR